MPTVDFHEWPTRSSKFRQLAYSGLFATDLFADFGCIRVFQACRALENSPAMTKNPTPVNRPVLKSSQANSRMAFPFDFRHFNPEM
jgi:hypothetical protein